jgi:hypothetical protein
MSWNQKCAVRGFEWRTFQRFPIDVIRPGVYGLARDRKSRGPDERRRIVL